MKQLRYQIVDRVRGTDAIGLLNELRTRQYDEPQTLLKATLAQRDEYFMELRRTIGLFNSVSQFEDLPILDKAFVAAHRNRLVNPNYKGKLFRKKTGGSTGEPLTYMTGARSQSYLWAGILLSWEAAGFVLGEPVAFLAGTSLFDSGWKQKIYYRLLNVTLLSAFDLSTTRLESHLESLDTGRFRLLYGYASAIHMLARHILENPHTSMRHHLKAVVCTAEVLSPVMRRDIEAAFRVPCFNQYGCQEAGVSAFECERHTGFHLISSRCHVEVLDDGRLISTDLANRSMFMPRYDTGDLVMMSEAVCDCGRGLPLIRQVKGRSNDIVQDSAGNVVHSEFFAHMFRGDLLVRAFQVVFDDDSLTINLHLDESQIEIHKSLCDRYLARIRAALKFRETSFEYNRPFIEIANSKHRYVMRRNGN